MIQTSSAGKRCSPIPNLHGLIPKPVPLAFNFTCTSKANRETAQPEAAVSTHRVPSTGPLGSPPQEGGWAAALSCLACVLTGQVATKGVTVMTAALLQGHQGLMGPRKADR